MKPLLKNSFAMICLLIITGCASTRASNQIVEKDGQCYRVVTSSTATRIDGAPLTNTVLRRELGLTPRQDLMPVECAPEATELDQFIEFNSGGKVR